MNIKQFKIIALMALLIMSALVITPLGLTQSANAQPPNILNQAPITIYNNQSAATTNPYQQKLLINESLYSGYITYSGSLANFEFSYANNTIIPSWIEQNNSGILSIWLNLTSIPANSNLTIYIDFASLTTNLLSNSGTTGIGEAPELSSTYAQYDNGASVFNFYDNFEGTTLSSVWTVPSGSTYSVNNGFIGTPNNYTSVYNPNIQETSSIIAEWGLNMSSTTYPNSPSQFQLNRYTGNSNMHFLGASGNDTLANNGAVTTKNIFSTGIQTFGIWNDGTTVTWYYEGNSYTDTVATAETDYLALGWAYGGQSYNFPIEYWVFTRAYPPNGVMLSVSYVAVSSYTVTFNESGLPSGSSWNITLSNNVYSTNTTLINVTLSNGNYSYEAQSSNGLYSPLYGNITVNGANQTVNLSFIISTYNIEINESGLPSGTLWNMTLYNSTYNATYYNSTNTTSLNFSIPNATYSYTALANNFYNPIYGNITVNGANVTDSIVFTLAPPYNVEFIESGLPSSALWNTTVNTIIGNFTNSTNTTLINFSLPNGTYNYSMSQSNLYVFLGNSNGNFTINGANTTVYLNFTLYAVNFNIINPYPYNITISNSTYSIENTYNNSFTEYMPNGTYNDSISVANISNPFAVISGLISPFTVNGTDLTFNITFSNYNVEYNITGLPSGATLTIGVYWSSNDTLMYNTTTTSQYAYLLLPSGSYYSGFNISNSNYIVENSEIVYTTNPPEQFGNEFTINNNNLAIINVPIIYDAITVYESGLTTNTQYYFSIILSLTGATYSTVELNSQSQTEYVFDYIPIDQNYTLLAWISGSSYTLTDTFYFTGNYTYDFNFVQILTSTGNITIKVYEMGLPINTLWYFNLTYIQNYNITYNVSSYYSFITLFNISQGIYSYTAYSQDYALISNPQFNVLNNTTITVNFLGVGVITGININVTNPYNTTNNFNFNLSQWETITFLGSSSVIMAVVGAFINPIGAFIVLGIEMIIGYELSIVDSWILFFVGLAITALIFYSRDSTKIEE